MAILSPLSIKLMLISTTVLSAAFGITLTAPTLTEFAIHELPSIYNNVASWLKPPYLYLVINFIIITIMFSSKFQSHKDVDVSLHPILHQEEVLPVETSVYVENDFKYNDDEVILSETIVKEVVSFVDETSNKENEIANEKKECFYSSPKPPAGKRFGSRKNEGGKTVLGVAKPKKQDTMESTWKTITEGRPMPLNRHLKKSDTWERDGRSSHQQRQEEKTPPKMKKSETFNDRTNPRSPSPGSSSSGGSAKIKKEPSLSQDELNKRVEAFIKKFNEDMRLQRQESLNQYKKVVHRGAR